MLDGGDADVVRAVVVASQHVPILVAQAGPVVGHAVIDLALDGGLAGLEDAVFWLAGSMSATTRALLLGLAAGAGRGAGTAG